MLNAAINGVLAIRIVKVEDSIEGYRLARNVYVEGNRIPLLREGITLDTSYIDSLKRHQVKYIYIEDPASEGIKVEDVIYEETRVLANAVMSDILSHNPPPLTKDNLLEVQKVARMIVSDIKEYKPRVTIELWNLKTLKDYLYLHSVNVAVVSVMIGWRMNLNNQELEDLSLGVLLHDVGKVTVADSIHNKPSKLTTDEFKEMQQHTARGFAFLRDRGAFNPIVWSVAHQHHEMFDGTGYPKGRKGKEIHQYSRIAVVADIFDALTSDRPYKSGWAFHKVILYMQNIIPDKLDPQVLKTFVSLIPLYPRGTAVKLSTGEMGMVVENLLGNYHQPIVRVIMDKSGRVLGARECREIDLSKETEISIAD